MTRVSHALDRIDATFDDPNLVANAGLLLVATLSERLGVPAFVAMWTLMMAAMMLPAVAPLASMYALYRAGATGSARGIRGRLRGGLGHRRVSIAFAVASLFDTLTEDRSAVAHVVAVVEAFAACGIYQLTPMKRWCLRHCRSPLGHLLQYVSYRGATTTCAPGCTTASSASDAAGC